MGANDASYIRFGGFFEAVVVSSPKRRYREYEIRCAGNRSCFGSIRWYTKLRQYAFFADPRFALTVDALERIAAFCAELNTAEREKIAGVAPGEEHHANRGGVR